MLGMTRDKDARGKKRNGRSRLIGSARLEYKRVSGKNPPALRTKELKLLFVEKSKVFEAIRSRVGDTPTELRSYIYALDA